MPSGTRPRAALVGPLHVDLFIRGSAPLVRRELNAWVGPSEVDLTVAGSLGYTAGAMARLGWSVELHSAVGGDPFGAHIRETLEERGMDVRHVRRADGRTAIAIYPLLFGGSKRPMTYRLPDFEPWPDPPRMLRADGPRPDLIMSTGLLHFPQMWHRSLGSTFQAGRAAGVLTAFDPQFPLTDTPPPWLPLVSDVLGHADVLLCDEHEARMMFDTPSPDDALRAARACGPGIVVIKMGSAGSRIAYDDIVIDQPALAVPDDRVTVGAGDAFDAGFLDALVRGGTPQEAARQGTAVAALSLGGSEAMDRAAVDAALPDVPRPTRRTLGSPRPSSGSGVNP